MVIISINVYTCVHDNNFNVIILNCNLINQRNGFCSLFICPIPALYISHTNMYIEFVNIVRKYWSKPNLGLRNEITNLIIASAHTSTWVLQKKIHTQNLKYNNHHNYCKYVRIDDPTKDEVVSLWKKKSVPNQSLKSVEERMRMFIW